MSSKYIYQNNELIELQNDEILKLNDSKKLCNNTNQEYNDVNMGVYYHILDNKDEAKRYYMMAIEKGNSDAMHKMGYLFHYKNPDEAKKYYMMAIKKGNSMAMSNLEEITTPLERYLLYQEYNIPFKEELTRDIHIFKNKCNFLSKESECPVCLETRKCIPLECAHYICLECYPKVYEDTCPVCKL